MQRPSLRDFSLFVIAFVLFVALSPIALVVKLYVACRDRSFNHEWFRRLAISIDQAGNVVADDLFNLILIKNSYDRFGNEDETISSVLGKNHKHNTLTYFGNALTTLLNAIDPNHTLKSIERSKLTKTDASA